MRGSQARHERGIQVLLKAKLPLTAIGVSLGVALAGCGGSSGPAIPVSAKLVSVPGSKTGQIILSQIGAQRIGLRTGTAVAVRSRAGIPGRHSTVVIPYSAVVYNPSGATFTFARVGRLRYQEVQITIDKIVGNSAYLVSGPQARDSGRLRRSRRALRRSDRRAGADVIGRGAVRGDSTRT